jgi:integrase/recombinase XerC
MLTDAFFDYLRYERGVSEHTLEGYRADLKAFRTFYKSLDSDLDWDSLDTDIARDWVVSMIDSGNKPTSVARRLSALRSCYRFLLRRGLVSRDPFHNLTAPKAERPLPAFIREGDMQRLLDNDEAFTHDFDGLRDRTVITVFYETGLRLAELIGLDMGDVSLGQQTLHVTGKGNRQRIVPFGDSLTGLLNKYIGSRAKVEGPDTQALFVDGRGRRIKPGATRAMVRRQLGLVTDQGKRSPHVLRHTFATTMLNHQANLEAVKELLGHRRLATTEIYTHTTFEELRREYNDAHPRA